MYNSPKYKKMGDLKKIVAGIWNDISMLEYLVI